jgi:hypothetical protein
MKVKLFAIAVIVIFSSHFFACSDSGDIVSTPKRTNVSGRVIGGYLNEGAAYVKVRIEDKITLTDEKGDFVINDVQIPYDVYITDTLYNKGSVFKNLTNTDCLIPNIVNLFNWGPLNEANIYITYSGIPENYNLCKTFFTDGKNINAIGTSDYCHILFPENHSIKGKVCVIFYTIDSNEVVLSYEKFGYIDNVTISPNSTTNLVFTDSMLSYNPPETLVSGTISSISPSNYRYINYFINMSPRKGFYYYPFYFGFCHITGNVFNILIPSNLPVEYYPILKCYSSDSGGQAMMNYELPKSGATGLNVSFPTTPVIFSPPALSYVDTNTIFSYSDNFGPQIYQIIIKDSLKSFFIYTNEKNINMQNLWQFGFGKFGANSKIKFSVNTLGRYNTVDDYANPNFKNVTEYSSMSVSREYIYKN